MSTEFYNRNWRMLKSSNSSKVSNYSMSFDGSSEVVKVDDFQLTNNTDTCSYSAWINIDSSATGVRGIFGKGKTGASFEFNVRYYTAGTNLFIIMINGSTVFQNSSLSISTDSWHHIAVVIDRNLSAGNNIKLFYDNVEISNEVSVSFNQFSSTSFPLYIGAEANTSTSTRFEFLGQIDHVSIFDYALSSSQVTALYGNSTDGVGNPMSLSTKPVAYYKIGDKAAFNGSEYLVTNAASEVYSPYALNFDAATSDVIVCGNTLGNGFSSITVSSWVNFDNPDSALREEIISKDSPSGRTFSLFKNKNSNWAAFGTVGLLINDGSTTSNATALQSDFTPSANTWYNVIGTWDGTNIKLYINGNLKKTTSFSASNLSTNTVNVLIGDSGWPGSLSLNGQLSNPSIWNAALTSTQVTELYGSGTPTNLNNHSAYSNLVSWWQLGENSSFNGGNWTVLDEKGTNDGTSTNMTEQDLVNGVGTSANGISDSMGGADNIVGNAPYSTANAVSYGMGVDALSTDVPS